MKINDKKAVVYLSVAAVVGIALFWGGMQYGRQTVSNGAQDRGGQRMGGAGASRRNNFMTGGFAGGEIASVDDKSITLKMQDGSTRFVFFSPATKILKSVDGAVGDLVAGKQVTVSGAANSDGSITAQSIQLRTADMPRGGAR